MIQWTFNWMVYFWHVVSAPMSLLLLWGPKASPSEQLEDPLGVRLPNHTYVQLLGSWMTPRSWTKTSALERDGHVIRRGRFVVWVGFCFGFVHRCWWGCGVVGISGAPDTPPLRHGSQRPLVKMMRLLFLILDLRTDVVKHLTIGSRSFFLFAFWCLPLFWRSLNLTKTCSPKTESNRKPRIEYT